MALSQRRPREPEEPSPHSRQQLQEFTPVDADSRSPPQESPPADTSSRSPPQESPPADTNSRSPPQESPPADAEPRSPPQDFLQSGSADSPSPPQETPPAGPAEPRSSPQESPPEGPAERRSPLQEPPRADSVPRSPPQDSLPEGPAEPRSSPQELPPADAEPRSPPQEPPSAGPEPRSAPRELPPAGPEPRSAPRELPPADAERRPSAAPGPVRQLRVLLTPLPAAAWPRPQKRLLSSAGTRDPAGKRPCPEPDSGPRAAPGSPPGPSSAARGQDGLWDADSDASDGEDATPDGYSHLSAYERKRLKNITENAKFFAALKLHESAARLHQLATKSQSHVTKRPKAKKAEDEPARRRSMRLLRVEPLDIPLVETPARPAAEEYPQVPAGPLPMVPEDQAENSKWTEALLGTWMRISELKADDADRGTPDIKRYQESLSSMVLSEENIRKVVKARVCSMAIHPSESIILVAAGDKWGQVGLWNVSCGTEEGAHTFIPHSFQVNCMHFSPCNPAHLLSLSNDTLRCGDVTRAVFDEICRSEEDFSCFDFLEENASTALVSHWHGAVAVVDRRTPGASSELSADIGFRRTRTVHVHPVNKQYFLAAGSTDVCVFDVRNLKVKGNKPLSSLTGHTRSVASAYFSPVTGSRVVTVCADDKLRVYDTTSLSSTVTLLSSIRHNNNTGRWLSRFRAIWDPKQEHCFLVGSMAQPRQIQVFQDTGDLLHSFFSADCLSSVCSINVVHPSQNILVGGNSSGRLHVFK